MKLYPVALEKYLEHPTCGVEKPSSKDSLRSTVRLFQQDHPELELHEVTSVHLEIWVGGRRKSGVSDTTLVKNIQRLNSLLTWAWRQGHIKSNPAEGLRKNLNLKPRPVREHRWLNQDEVQQILDSFDILTSQDHRDALVLRLGFTAGLRNNEIRTLPLSALSRIDNQRISVKGKGDKIAQVWVPERTAELLVEWQAKYEQGWREVRQGSLDESVPVIVGFKDLQDWETGERMLTPRWGTGITQQAVGRIVKERSKAAGYPISPHDMRRAFAGMVYEATHENLRKTQQALRHSSVATTEIYLEQRQDAAAVAVESAGLGLR